MLGNLNIVSNGINNGIDYTKLKGELKINLIIDVCI
jgi:hypothetical protein